MNWLFRISFVYSILFYVKKQWAATNKSTIKQGYMLVSYKRQQIYLPFLRNYILATQKFKDGVCHCDATHY